jgi:hypothetical protein
MYSSFQISVGILATLTIATSTTSVNAFSTPTPTTHHPHTIPRPFIEFTNPLQKRGIVDRLPASFVSTWPTWVLQIDTTTKGKKNWQKIPDSDGFVPPTSVEELWHCKDLKLPQCQLALGLHVRDGMIRHILPAVDLSLGEGDDGHGHRNRGLCSVPRAYEWMDFGAAMAGGLDVMTLALQIKKEDAQDEDDWETLAEIESIEDSINAVIKALAEDPPEELGDGSNIVHLLYGTEKAVVCPQPGSVMRALLKEDGYTVGTLQVSVESIAPGSESDYLPEVYKPLFQDESLIRPAFVETKKRMELRAEKGKEKEAEAEK